MVFTTWSREISYCRSVSASRLMRRIGTCGRVSVAAHGIRPGYLGIGVAKFPHHHLCQRHRPSLRWIRGKAILDQRLADHHTSDTTGWRR